MTKSALTLDQRTTRTIGKLEAHWTGLREILDELLARKAAMLSAGYRVEHVNDALQSMVTTITSLTDATYELSCANAPISTEIGGES